MHDGVDFPARKGTEVLATADGTVKVAKKLYTPNKSYGREIVIDHGDGYETRYAHLSKVKVHKGQKVSRWEVIGEVGQTGRATGDHLHYEVILSGKRQNPEHYIYN
jgi:murein DD-endopeptidase MepM/ murein hydrolase activator NlpD